LKETQESAARPPSTPRPQATPDVAAAGPVVVAVQGEEQDARQAAGSLAARLRASPAAEPVVLVAVQRGGATALVPFDAPPDGASQQALPGASAASQGAVPAHASPLGPLLREGVARGAKALAIVAAEPHDTELDWLDTLLSPVLREGFDFVCPAYRRHRTDGAINSGIVSPLLRALYRQGLHQPLGTEIALSPVLARRLLADPDWDRRPAQAGSDAWVLAKVLGSEARVAQAWLGAWPAPRSAPQEASQALIRALGLVFTEMERDASRWQRGGAAAAVTTFGVPAFESGGERLDPDWLTEAFANGFRDLRPVLGLVLPPVTLLSLQRAASRTGSGADLADDLWARVIFDFAVAHMTRAVERRQLLASLTPLYLGWLAGLARASAALDDAGFEARLEALGAAFEAEKRYLVTRWRWPDEFNP
jgi:hypothetical protein